MLEPGDRQRTFELATETRPLGAMKNWISYVDQGVIETKICARTSDRMLYPSFQRKFQKDQVSTMVNIESR